MAAESPGAGPLRLEGRWVGEGAGEDRDLAAARWELRLASALVALWAVLATTTLLWVLTDGGAAGVRALASDPLRLFAFHELRLWAAGAVGALAILGTAFVINQLVGRAYLKLLAPRRIPWPSRLPRPATETTLARFDGGRAEAFGFTLLERRPGSFARVRRREVILVSDRLLAVLTPEEIEAVLAHELGHVAALDGRYLTFLRTLARLVRWDPLFALLSRSLTRVEEERADAVAVALTGRPAALARALRAVASLTDGASPRPIARGLLGSRGAAARARVEARIQRLLERAAAGEDAPP